MKTSPIKTETVLPTPIVVSPDADADTMNTLHGESYGVDWVYSSTPKLAQPVSLSSELKQQNQQLREQNTRLDKLCAEYEVLIKALRQKIP